jgi:ATP-dependent helicase HrpB
LSGADVRAAAAAAAELRRLAVRALGEDAVEHIADEALRHALFVGYADRLGKRRPGSVDRYLLASGHGAALGREAAADASEFIVALDVTAAQRDAIGEARVRAASRVEREWIQPTSVDIEHRFDGESGRVRAANVARYDAIVLSETPVPADAAITARLLAAEWQARERDHATSQLLERIRFAGVAVDLPAAIAEAAEAADCLDDIDLARHLPRDVSQKLAQLAPPTLLVPSARSIRLDYSADGSVSCAVKLQELFGLAESPVLGPDRLPVTFHLLAPNGRPVQTTRDLRSFWERTYPEVRKELRGRYPRHPWPEDPWNALPTHRTTRRR